MIMKLILLFCLIPLTVLPQAIDRIAFGSCLNEELPQDIWYTVLLNEPDVFVLLGDNVYGDTKNMKELREKYRNLGAKPGFAKLRNKIPVLATWDDHDYGADNSGKGFLRKKASKEVFLDFFNEPDTSERRKHDGIYHSVMLGTENKIVQFLLLDLRTFRDGLNRFRSDQDCIGPYDPVRNTNKTFLGKEQWKWLEEELKKPADLRIICSSLQFLCEWNGMETWNNMPHERERLIRLIGETSAKGVVFISGDVHYAEISKVVRPEIYTLFDITSSGMTHGNSCAAKNRYRIGEPYLKANFGIIDIDWLKKQIRLRILDPDGKEIMTHLVLFSEIGK